MRKFLLWIVLPGIVLAGAAALWFYPKVYGSNTSGEDEYVLYIPTSSLWEDVQVAISPALEDQQSFVWVAGLKKYPDRIRPGRYVIEAGSSNNSIVNMLRAGLQTPVRVTFTPTRYVEEIAGKVAAGIEADSLDLLYAMTHPDTARAYGFSPQGFPSMFLPNSYEMYWNTDVHGFLSRMQNEYKRFWTEKRIERAKRKGLTPEQSTTLASIIQEEVAHLDEAERVAGVYVNRVKRGMKLDADPTLKFAAGDWSLRRVLNRHKEIDSPYNTYKYAGVPPGPITYPSTSLIDAVLQAEDHDYIFFVAKADRSGYHQFSKTYSQHLRYARQYQQSLNNRGVY